MMKIYKVKKKLNYVILGGLFGCFNEGKRLFEESSGDGFYPESGYPIFEYENLKFVDEYLELIEENDKSKDYYINKIYTQEQMDALKKKLKPKK